MDTDSYSNDYNEVLGNKDSENSNSSDRLYNDRFGNNTNQTTTSDETKGDEEEEEEIILKRKVEKSNSFRFIK
jgi:hypothetical protein